jgi:hypothetical protein
MVFTGEAEFFSDIYFLVEESRTGGSLPIPFCMRGGKN